MNTIPLVLLPGTLCDARVWHAQANALSSAREVRVCELGDQPAMHEEVAALLKTLPPRFYLAGFSLGAIVAFEFVRQARERAAGLALVASTARSDPAENQARRRALLARAKRGELAGVLNDELLPFYFSPVCKQREVLSNLVVSMAESCAPRFGHHTRYAVERPDSRPMLSSLKIPALILYGDDDGVIPFDRQTEMAEAMPHALFRGVPDCGHFVPLEAPDVCSQAMQDWMELPLND
ncbi:alpha/beta hydrolase [Caballeronia sp. GAFFF2]|uniref:alpha/beta fold hydrolase n=1 Tax=Caballeronia sp. GAFFF2 TaxID=2921741 RepID=UPI00202927AC|nr:alpha/beta hydrolase [Caballeronia sp. GAFFF2]